MIEGRLLLGGLRQLLTPLRDDLRDRIGEDTALEAGLRADWTQARDRGRTGAAYADWLEDEITQAAVHWVLACVFLRFIEDNGLVERPWLSGATRALRDLAQDRHEQYFRAHPLHSDRDYLLHCFEDAAALPALGGLFDRAHNPLWRIAPSGDGAMALLGLWRAVDPDTGALHHDFTDPDLDTRFLGDLYQDLSEPVRKKYALLQTPEFVEEFILDRTLSPAIREFGYREVRMIDPTCGSGHFLLGAFRRLFDLWAANEPARNLPDLVQRALDAVHGVDINPYAVAIARFRLHRRGAGRRRRAAARGRPGLPGPGRGGRQPAPRPALHRPGPGRGGGPAGRHRLRPRLRHRGPGGGQPHPGAAVPRGGGQPALHHRQGHGAQWLYRERYETLPPAVLAGRAVRRTLLRPRARRRRRPQPAGFVGHDHRQLLHEAGVRQEADRGVLAAAWT